MRQNKLNAKSIALLCIIPLIVMLVMRKLGLYPEQEAKTAMRLALCGIIAYGLYLAHMGRLSSAKIVTLLITAGVVLRFGYTLYTHAFVRFHDLGLIDINSSGHYAYLANIVEGHLPPSNDYQFYQPPFYYMVSAFFVKLAMFISPGAAIVDLLYIPQLVSCVASCITLIFSKKIMDELNISSRTQIAAVAITAFYPAQIYTAGRLNNDSLVLMFMVLSLYFTLKWHKSTDIIYIVGIAFSIALGMMTKINGAIVAFIIGPVMIWHFVKCIASRDSEKIKDIIIQLLVFAVICFPLGLWYPIRNYIKFAQPLGYVYEIGDYNPVYTGYASFFDRWISVPFTKFKQLPYMDMANDTSILMCLIKTGVHGEFTWDSMSNLLAWLSDYAHSLLILLAAVSITVIMLKNKKRRFIQKIPVFALWLITAISYVLFNISYPYICTADFRYVFLGQMAAAVFIAYWLERCRKGRHLMMYILSMGVVLLFCVVGLIHIC